jgi:predicted RNase H-like HicB family nuclease
MDYIAYLHKDRRSDVGVSFPDFPGCITAGRNLEEARRKAAEALSLHIAGMLEDGEKIPKPSTLDDVANDSARKDAVLLLVPARSERTIRFNVTAKESQLEKIDLLAHAARSNRSAYMVQMACQASGSVRRKASRKSRIVDRRRK